MSNEEHRRPIGRRHLCPPGELPDVNSQRVEKQLRCRIRPRLEAFDDMKRRHDNAVGQIIAFEFPSGYEIARLPCSWNLRQDLPLRKNMAARPVEMDPRAISPFRVSRGEDIYSRHVDEHVAFPQAQNYDGVESPAHQSLNSPGQDVRE